MPRCGYDSILSGRGKGPFRVLPARTGSARLAIDIHDSRSLHAAQLVRGALRNMNVPIASAEVLLLGPSYPEDVGDTGYSGSEIKACRLTEMGAKICVHDPYVDRWWEFESQGAKSLAREWGEKRNRSQGFSCDLLCAW